MAQRDVDALPQMLAEVSEFAWLLRDRSNCTVLLNMAFSRHLDTFREICHGKRSGKAI